jgi:acetylornithine deacetylase/succinyl-diaminopimelate desuccinylase-like protein
LSATTHTDHAIACRLREVLSPLLATRPVATNPAGLRAVADFFEAELRRCGFDLRRVSSPGGQDVLVARRRGSGQATLGLAAHYDVEEAGDGWSHDPFAVTLDGARLYGRGLADNLGPLLLRLFVLAEMPQDTPDLVMLLQGEEEIGSPAAHRIYPALDLPPVDLWLEETGYFELDGRQRLLVRRPRERTAAWIQAAVDVAQEQGRGVDRHDRYLNKAFGEQRCPFLTHLVGDANYLAIGPNDPESRIHKANESLATGNLALSARQFEAVLRAAAEGP